MEILCNAYVRSKLGYCSSMWNSSTIKYSDWLKKFKINFSDVNIDNENPIRISFITQTEEFQMDLLKGQRTNNDIIFIFKMFSNLFELPELLGKILISVPHVYVKRSNNVLDVLISCSPCYIFNANPDIFLLYIIKNSVLYLHDNHCPLGISSVSCAV